MRFQNLIGPGPSDGGSDNRMIHSDRESVVGSAIEHSTGLFLSHAAPLFEEKWNALALTLIANGGDPFLFKRPCAGSAFPTYNHPMDATKIEFTQILKQRF